MKVSDYMSTDLQTIGPEANVDEALRLMKAHGVRHLPVLQGGRLVGLVNDIELRTAWFPSLLDELLVKDVMNADPATIDADATIYQAARMVHNSKLTGLPVEKDGELVGIITLADILGVLVDLLGLLESTSRLDVGLRSDNVALEEVHSIIRAHGGEVVSVALLSSDPPPKVYSFRLMETNLEDISGALRSAGHTVLD